LPPARPGQPAVYPEFQALLHLGLLELGAEVLADGLADANPAPSAWLSLAGAAGAAQPYQGWRAATRLLRAAPDDYEPDLLPPPADRALLPLPFGTILERQARAHRVDPFLVASVMRQESRYNPSAKSAAAARGLMQFIPSTATEVAAGIGLALGSMEELYRPEVSIALGCAYLRQLLDRFGGDVYRAVAAYNTGAARVELWSRKCRSCAADEFVAEIYLEQPRTYVQEVMRNLAEYRRLYGPQPELLRRARAAPSSSN
jgi:soluble lytic murein transglycosylase